MAVLNYKANVPLNMKASFTIQADPNKPPGERFKDYIPKNVVPVTKPDETVRRKNFAKPPVARYSEDYVSGSESAKRRVGEKESIITIAKNIWDEQAPKILAFKDAEKTMADEKANEQAKEKAKRILDRSKPLTKEECMEKAAKQFYGLSQ